MRQHTRRRLRGTPAATLVLILAAACGGADAPQARTDITPEEARAIAKEAYTYANPMVDSYRIIYSYFLDPEDPEFKAPLNTLYNFARVYTPDDRAVQSPNSDTPYSWLAVDLRTEPFVLTVPPIEEGRYFSIQLVDLYTHNFDYIGSRNTGNEGGSFLVAGPGWGGDVPEGITRVLRSETELVLAVYRTQLFSPDDIDQVEAIQADYGVEPLSAFVGRSVPEPAPAIEFIEPLSAEEIRQSPRVFEHLNFVLQFCPTHPSEVELMERFARLDIGAGRTFDWDTFPPEIQEAIGQGIEDAWADFAQVQARVDAGEVGSGDAFGTREHLDNNYLYRMAAAVIGIWGNSEEEAIYPTYFVDADGNRLDGAERYTLRFAPGELPPVNAFWSLTMYDLPDRLLVANPIDRYLFNSTMLDDFVRDEDGGITLHVQQDSPGSDREANWLPAPEGGFYVILRLYWPQAEALDGTWQLPPMTREGAFPSPSRNGDT